NIVGGLQVEEPAADLAIVGAILSSLFNKPLASSAVIFGEVGLGGEIRPAMFPEIRLKEAAVLGFQRGIIPPQSIGADLQSSIQTVRVRNVQEAREVFFS